jgi:hypothetical protein
MAAESSENVVNSCWLREMRRQWPLSTFASARKPSYFSPEFPRGCLDPSVLPANRKRFLFQIVFSVGQFKRAEVDPRFA